MRLYLPRRVFLLLTLFTWLTGTFVSLWHERVVRHVRCERHGDLMEITGDTGDREPGIYAAAPDGHKSCVLPMPAPGRPVRLPELALLPEDAPLDTVPLDRLPGARAPPLQYAPKTSPPHA